MDNIYEDFEKREKTKKESSSHLYEGECIRCGRFSNSLDKETDLCFGCIQADLEIEERKNAFPYELGDKEDEFRHEKEIQRWDDSLDEEIWNKHFRYK